MRELNIRRAVSPPADGQHPVAIATATAAESYIKFPQTVRNTMAYEQNAYPPKDDKGDQYGDKGDHGKDHDYEHGKTIYGTDEDDWLYGTKHDDHIYGEKGDDHIYGGKGDDQIYGGKGDDKLYGDKGDDKLYGDKGDDDLYGGKGDDKLWGGKGKDTFHFDEKHNGHDTVYDFDEKKDHLDFGDFKDQVEHKDNGHDTTYYWDDSSVTVKNYLEDDHGHHYDWM